VIANADRTPTLLSWHESNALLIHGFYGGKRCCTTTGAGVTERFRVSDLSIFVDDKLNDH
jgi:hypothetical protein